MADLYDTDVVAWAYQQAALLRARQWSSLDLENIAEEIEGVAKAEKRAGRTASQGLVVSYIHHNAQVGVLLELNSETDFVARNEAFQQLARDIALHIASADPIGVSAADIPADLLERERRIAEEQVAAEGKPENVRAKIVEGKLKKFVAERTLLEHARRADRESRRARGRA